MTSSRPSTYGSVTTEGRADLGAYLASLAAGASSTLSPPVQMALLFRPLQRIGPSESYSDRYPVGSIREIDISPGLLSDGPWQAN